MTALDSWSDEYVPKRNDAGDYGHVPEADDYAYLADEPEPGLDTNEDAYASRAWDGLGAPTPPTSRRFVRQHDEREELRRATTRLIVRTGAYHPEGARTRFDGGGKTKRGYLMEERRPTDADLREIKLNLDRLDLPSANHHDIDLTPEQEEIAALMLQEDCVGHGRRRTGKITRNGERRVYESPRHAAIIDFLLSGGYGIETHAAGDKPGVPSSPAGSPWERSSIIMRLKIVVLLADWFEEWQQINGTRFAAGRGRKPRHEKYLLAAWIGKAHTLSGIPLRHLTGIVSRPYRTVADLAAYAAALASDASQPSRSSLATGVGGDGLAPVATSFELDTTRVTDNPATASPARWRLRADGFDQINHDPTRGTDDQHAISNTDDRSAPR